MDSRIVKVNKDSFELDNGMIFDLPFELDEIPTVEEFNNIYQRWKQELDQEDKDG